METVVSSGLVLSVEQISRRRGQGETCRKREEKELLHYKVRDESLTVA